MERLLETERLVVRALSDGDADALCAVYGDPDAMRWVGDGKALDRDQCVSWIEVTKRNYEARGYGMFALVLKELPGGPSMDRLVVGFCGIVHPGGQPKPEIKYALRREYWGMGLATEAVRGVLAFGTRAFGLSRIIATLAEENVASRRVLEKAGMSYLETIREQDGSNTEVFALGVPRKGRRF